MLLLLFVMFSKLLLLLRSSIDTYGLNESVWKSSEKEKLENLLDILDEVNGKFIQKIKIGILKDKFYLILHVMTI